MNVPENLRYAATHEWARLDPDGTIAVGISDHAQDSLGELVFIELPVLGRTLAAGEACAVVESVKAASDFYAPVAGEVVARNEALADTPGELNKDSYAAWMFRIKPAPGARLENLMDADAYRKSFRQA